MPDVLSDVLGTLQFRGQVFGSLELPPPWGLRVTPREQFTFHLIVRGQCWLEVPDRAAIHASTGDILVLAPRHAHVVRDAPKSRVRPIEEVIGQYACTTSPDPSSTLVVCGAFRVDDDTLLAGLPAVIHTHELASDAGPCLAFAKAFKRALGVPPGEYRATAQRSRWPAVPELPRTASRGGADRAARGSRAPAA